MEPKTLVSRVVLLERQMKGLSGLPDRVAGLEMFLQFRAEVKDEFSSLRQEMREGWETLRQEIRAGDEETRRFMRVLHEDVISRIALLDQR